MTTSLELSPMRDHPYAPDLAGLSVLLVQHWLYTWAGSERVLEQLCAMMPQADVLAGIVTPAMRERQPIARHARESWVGRIPGARTHHRWFLPAHALAFHGFDTRRYDLIVSVSHAFEKAIRSRGSAVHVCYCLTPPRYLWDLGPAHDALASGPQRAALRVARAPLRAIDRRIARGVDHFVSLSHIVARRVQRAYGRQSAVVYPPVATKPAPANAARGNFLLSLGRLVAYKRVDLAVRAANQLGLPLIVAGDGPERAKLEKLAGPTVTFTGEVSEQRAGELLATCAAFVFCAEEDFGIAPLEANAHGAPVVAYRAGGAAETLRDGESAEFFDEQTPEAVAAAVVRCLDRHWDVQLLYENAARFAAENFRAGMRTQILAALEAKRV